ncbi:hypothetical protein [Aureimonas pseudogalii]|uniref:Uncharacterized protein n=1 Tax=Aureimonas pseudogalii TaxID=1744844 RepID=A0A7W6H7N2_9HYPH|nr:hypothetical protein [Aureimonas pseudogalii]MBB4000134.1 hypothetical protein [Aureimonas pseudogalii]
MRKNTLLVILAAATLVGVQTAEADSLSEARKGAQRGVAIFQKTYEQSGMGGLNGASQDCWKAFRAKPSPRKLAECGAIDISGYHLDNTASKRMGWEPVEYMTLPKATVRYDRAEKALKLSAREEKAIQKIVVAAAFSQ